ncbi:MAG: hypothetical protein ABJA79_01415 [Parafilimonas sp.]
MRLLTLILQAALLSQTGIGQYYYNDIISAKQFKTIYLSLKANNIKQVTAISFDADNSPTPDFIFDRQILNNTSVIKTITQYSAEGKSFTASYYNNDQLTKTIDSSDNVSTTVVYRYDNTGKIYLITTTTEDAVIKNHTEEIHEWHYNDDSSPAYMLRIKDKTDTVLVSFTKDERGNIAEERWQKKGTALEHYYYYYNNTNLLTDVVRYNSKAARLLPDLLFDYNKTGAITEMTQITEGSSNYITWQYVYDERGLKKEDVLFNKQKEMIGRIEYSYK